MKKPKPEFSRFPRDKEMQEVENDLLFYVISARTLSEGYKA